MNNLLINNPSKGPGAKIYFCKVIRFMPSSNTVDCVTIDNNISLLDCAVACSIPAGFAYGSRYFPHHDDQNPELNYINSPGDIYCVAAFLENDYNATAVLGFLFPMETTLSIAEHGLYIFRHESDVIWMVRSDGTMQVYHPSGSIIKIGDDNTNEVDSDREQAGLYPAKAEGLHLRSTIDYNAQKETNLFIKWHKGQELTLDNDGNVIVKTKNTEDVVQTVLTMTPDGDVSVFALRDVTVSGRNVNVAASQNATVSVGSDATLEVFGNLAATVTGNASLDVGGSADLNVAGSATLDVVGATTVTTGSLNINAPLASPLLINGKQTLSGIAHAHGGTPQVYSEQGLILTGPP